MDELENNINCLMHEINQNWVDEVKDAEKSGEGLDLSRMFGKYSEIVKKKEKAFQDAKIRLSGKKKKGWF